MERFREADRWLEEADWDLGNAEILLKARRYNAAAFYSQQSAEKAVKAMLYAFGEIPLGHSIRELLERCSKLGLDVKPMMALALELDRHYIPSRYPNAHPSGPPHKAYDEHVGARVLDSARQIVDYVKANVDRLRKT